MNPASFNNKTNGQGPQHAQPVQAQAAAAAPQVQAAPMEAAPFGNIDDVRIILFSRARM